MNGVNGRCEPALAAAACVEPATDRARAFLGSRRLGELPEEVFRLGEVWILCERCVARGDAAGADGLYALLAGFAARRGSEPPAGFWPGTAALYLGLLAATAGRADVAAAHLEEALRVATTIGAAVQVARTQLAYARLLLARGAAGDAARAHRLLVELLASLQLPEAGAAAPLAPAVAPAPARGSFVFRREGDYWTLASPGRLARVRGVRGFEYIVELLRRPHSPVYVVELMKPLSRGGPGLSVRELDEHGLHVVAATRNEAEVDRRARHDYRARVRELLAEQAAAEGDNDPGRAARAEREIEMLARELTTGRHAARGATSAQERARVNVRNCVSTALRAVRRHDEPLWRHLVNTIKTGTYCVYEPDQAIDWEL